MKTFGEIQALLIALAVSTVTLGLTFGFAVTMRHLLHPASESRSVTVVALAPEATEGRHLFLMNCAHCHGDDAHGDEGPDLYDLRKSDERIHTLITAGIKGEMPSFAKKLGDPDIRALTAYLRTLKS